MCARHASIRALFLSTDLIHADGMPLVFASRLLCKTALPERVATTDLFHDVARIALERGATFYLLGATSAIIEGRAARAHDLPEARRSSVTAADTLAARKRHRSSRRSTPRAPTSCGSAWARRRS